jgi:uncharacterized phage protein (TIGR01671 family)
MREIRFRFWDACRNKMLTRANEVMPLLENQTCGGYDYSQEGSAFEQFTGLHDKNGKEIFEGDILRVGTFREEVDGEESWWMDDSVHRVEWYGAKDYPAFDLRPSIDTDCNGLAYIAVGEQQAEVIGNIHENPELLA